MVIAKFAAVTKVQKMIIKFGNITTSSNTAKSRPVILDLFGSMATKSKPNFGLALLFC